MVSKKIINDLALKDIFSGHRLMGEALTPRAKIGTQFKKGKTNLLEAAEEIRGAVSTSSQDIVVIVNGKLKAGEIDTGKMAEVLKAAG